MKIVIELRHPHQYFQRDAEYVTKVYIDGELVETLSGDKELEMRKFAAEHNYKIIVERPIRAGKLMFKTERFG